MTRETPRTTKRMLPPSFCMWLLSPLTASCLFQAQDLTKQSCSKTSPYSRWKKKLFFSVLRGFLTNKRNIAPDRSRTCSNNLIWNQLARSENQVVDNLQSITTRSLSVSHSEWCLFSFLVQNHHLRGYLNTNYRKWSYFLNETLLVGVWEKLLKFQLLKIIDNLEETNQYWLKNELSPHDTPLHCFFYIRVCLCGVEKSLMFVCKNEW